MQEEFKRIPLRDIEPDPNQPRKHFDETALRELAHSISQYDVIEPIMVRPSKSKNGKFIIVVGERRFRAAGMAALADIPAIIRKLTDGEALEVQITENLQRENVNPMEEAEAFKVILDSKRYKPKELAARIGKKVEYILQRVKLCDLIPEFQELVYADKLKLTQAYLVCRFAKEVQQSYAGKIPKDWKEQPTGWKLSDIYFGNATHNLDEATFKTEDPKLNPKMGACGQCPFNSAVSQLPFDGMENSRICSNPSCYEIKQVNDFKNKLQEVAADDEVLFVAKRMYGDEATLKINAAKETGKAVLQDGQYKILQLPTPPEPLPTFEDYVKENEWEEDTTEEGQRSDYNDELEEYQEEVTRYQERLKEYEEKKPFVRKAYVVTGYRDEGHMIEVYVPDENAGNNNAGVAEKIIDLRRRHDTTNKTAEINFLKKDLAPALKELPTYSDREDPLELNEWLAVFHLLYQRRSNGMREEMSKDFGGENLNSTQIVSSVAMTGRTGPIFKWMRRMLLAQLHEGQSFEYDNTSLEASLHLVKMLCFRYMPQQLTTLQAEYKDKQQARKDKLNQQIAALQQTEIPAEA